MELIFDLAGEAAADRATELGGGQVGDPGYVGVPRVPEVPRSTRRVCFYFRHRGLPFHSQGAAGAFLRNKLYTCYQLKLQYIAQIRAPRCRKT